MEKQFVPYEQALKLKELGFDDECFGFYTELGNIVIKENVKKQDCTTNKCIAPIWQQVFDWFDKEFSLLGEIYKDYKTLNSDFDYGFSIGISISKGYDIGSIKTYEEARLECIKSLIEIVKLEK